MGLAIAGANDLGIANGSEKVSGYGRMPNGTHFDFWCAKFTKQIPYNRLQAITGQVQVGDLLTFWIDKEGLPRHMAIFTGVDRQGNPWMIHSYAKEKRGVIEMPIDTSYWTRRIHNVYRIKELF